MKVYSTFRQYRQDQLFGKSYCFVGERYDEQNSEIVDSLKRLKDETSSDLTALEKKMLDQSPGFHESQD